MRLSYNKIALAGSAAVNVALLATVCYKAGGRSAPLGSAISARTTGGLSPVVSRGAAMASMGKDAVKSGLVGGMLRVL